MLCKARRALCKTNCWREPGASLDHPTVNTACPTERWERLVAQEALGMHVIPHQKCAVRSLIPAKCCLLLREDMASTDMSRRITGHHVRRVPRGNRGCTS